jgi:hypothetical protein
MEAIPTQLRLHATGNNLAPSALDHEPSACALGSSRSLLFIAPLRLRWSPVILQRAIPSISFPFTLLRDSSVNDNSGYTHPHPFKIGLVVKPASSKAFNSFTLIFLRTLLHNRILQPSSFQSLPNSFAKTPGGTYSPLSRACGKSRVAQPILAVCHALSTNSAKSPHKPGQSAALLGTTRKKNRRYLRKKASAVCTNRGAASRKTGPWLPLGTTQRAERGMARYISTPISTG